MNEGCLIVSSPNLMRLDVKKHLLSAGSTLVVVVLVAVVAAAGEVVVLGVVVVIVVVKVVIVPLVPVALFIRSCKQKQ